MNVKKITLHPTQNIFSLVAEETEFFFPRDKKFIVILPAYYNHRHSYHRSARLAVKRYNDLVSRGYKGVSILDNSGNRYDVNFSGNLVRWEAEHEG